MSGSKGPIRGARVLSMIAAFALIATLAVAASSPAAAQDGRTVDLRVLVVAGDPATDPAAELMEVTLEALGIPYDLLDASQQDLEPSMLFDGNRGFYNGIILTDAELFVPPNTSGFTEAEWTLLHDYERDFGVREAVVAGSPSDIGDVLDYGLVEVEVSGEFTGRWVEPAGESAFAYVNVDEPFPITDFTVATQPAPTGPDVTPLLVDDANPDNILIAQLDYDDGRQVLFSGIAGATFLLHSRVLAYEFVRFATSGLHLGAQRAWLSIHVDDLFLSSPLWNVDENFSDFAVTYRNLPGDVENVVAAQGRLVDRFDSLSELYWELAFNAAGSPLVDDGSLAMLADATVNSELAGRRYGGSGALRAGGDHSFLLRFDAIPPENDVGTVLRLARTDTGPVAGEVCPVTEPWVETEVSWEQAGDGTPWTGAAGPVTDASKCLSFDLGATTDPIEIRTLIDDWNGGTENNGVQVTVSSGSLTVPSLEGGSGPALYYGTAPVLPDPLSDAVLANAPELAFLNHTFTHRDLDRSNNTFDEEAFFELSRNLTAWVDLGFPGLEENRDTLVTGQHSGLSEDQGTFFDTSDDVVFPEGANPSLLDAMEQLGIRYTASDVSRPNQDRDQFVPGREVVILPRWPANVFFDASTPAEMAAEYNFLFHQNYLDQGLDPCVEPGALCEPVSYDEILPVEADRALLRLLSGRRWPHYFHITNIADYDGQGSTLLEDWIVALVDRYEDYMTLPIDSPLYYQVGEDTEASLAVLDGAVAASVDVDSGVVTLIADRDVRVEVTGVEGGRVHGGQPVRSVVLESGAPVTMQRVPTALFAEASTRAAVGISATAPAPSAQDAGRLTIRGGASDAEALVAFDDLPSRAVGGTAHLVLADVWAVADTAAVEVCAVDEAWDPETVTFDGGGPSVAACVTGEVSQGQAAAIDITAIVSAWEAGSANNGVVIRTSVGGLGFAGPGTDHPPTLVVQTSR